MKQASTALLAAALLAATPALAKEPIRVGVLEDMSGGFADITGPGSVLAATMAVEDFGGSVLGRPIEILQGDHQNKADIGSSIARRWIDEDKVDLLTGLGNSAVALAVRAITKEREVVDVVASAGVADLTGKACSSTGFHWSYDSYALAKNTAKAVVADGGKSWFFITANYAYGHAAQRDSTKFVESAGGSVVGSVQVPPNTADFSSYLLAAQSSGARVVGIASGGSDFSNTIKQAGEFGLVAAGQTMAGLAVFITDVHALGLSSAEGLYLTSPFYWGMDDKSREWSQRFFAKRKAMPTMAQVGVYSAVTHYLKSVAAVGNANARAVAAKMHALPVNDFWSKDVTVRADGRVLRDMHLFKVKAASESRKPWDYYQYISTVAGEEAFRPVTESECPLIK